MLRADPSAVPRIERMPDIEAGRPEAGHGGHPEAGQRRFGHPGTGDPGAAHDGGPPGAGAASRSRSAARGFMLAVLAFAIAFLACLVARLVSPTWPGALLIWPGAAVALAFASRRGPLWALPAAAGAATWAWFESMAPVLSATAFFASLVGPIATVHLIRRLRDWQPAHYRLDYSLRFAMAVMARMVDLPSRYVEGYLAPAGGSDGTIVTGENAHAWVEVWLDGQGWVGFENSRQRKRPPGHFGSSRVTRMSTPRSSTR